MKQSLARLLKQAKKARKGINEALGQASKERVTRRYRKAGSFPTDKFYHPKQEGIGGAPVAAGAGLGYAIGSEADRFGKERKIVDTPVSKKSQSKLEQPKRIAARNAYNKAIAEGKTEKQALKISEAAGKKVNVPYVTNERAAQRVIEGIESKKLERMKRQAESDRQNLKAATQEEKAGQGIRRQIANRAANQSAVKQAKKIEAYLGGKGEQKALTSSQEKKAEQAALKKLGLLDKFRTVRSDGMPGLANLSKDEQAKFGKEFTKQKESTLKKINAPIKGQATKAKNIAEKQVQDELGRFDDLVTKNIQAGYTGLEPYTRARAELARTQKLVKPSSSKDMPKMTKIFGGKQDAPKVNLPKGENIPRSSATSAPAGQVSGAGIVFDPNKKVDSTGLRINKEGKVVPRELPLRGTPGQEKAKGDQQAVAAAQRRAKSAVLKAKGGVQSRAIKQGGRNVRETERQKPSSKKTGMTVSADNYDYPIGVVGVGGSKPAIEAAGAKAAMKAKDAGKNKREQNKASAQARNKKEQDLARNYGRQQTKRRKNWMQRQTDLNEVLDGILYFQKKEKDSVTPATTAAGAGLGVMKASQYLRDVKTRHEQFKDRSTGVGDLKPVLPKEKDGRRLREWGKGEFDKDSMREVRYKDKKGRVQKRYFLKDELKDRTKRQPKAYKSTKVPLYDSRNRPKGFLRATKGRAAMQILTRAGLGYGAGKLYERQKRRKQDK